MLTDYPYLKERAVQKDERQENKTEHEFVIHV